MNAGHLAAQMVAIVNDLPALIQQTLRYDLESGKLRLDYKRHLDAFDAINKRIYYEREQQSIIQARMSAIKVKQTEVPVTPLSSSSVLGSSAFDSDIGDQSEIHDKSSASSILSSAIPQGSPVSTRTKRKGIIFSDNMRVKRIKREASGSTSATPGCLRGENGPITGLHSPHNPVKRVPVPKNLA